MLGRAQKTLSRASFPTMRSLKTLLDSSLPVSDSPGAIFSSAPLLEQGWRRAQKDTEGETCFDFDGA